MIGAGDVTEVKSGPAFNKIEQSALVAVMRRDAQKAADYAERHGVPYWYTDADELLRDDSLNAIYIATPPYAHLDYAERALKRGKMVYVEKPMVMNQEEAKALVELVEQYNGKLVVAHYRREMPYFLKIKELLQSKIIGESKMVRLVTTKKKMTDQETWRTDPTISGGGLFHDLAPHQIDFMLTLFGTPLRYTGVSDSSADKVSGQILFEKDVLFEGSWFFDTAYDADCCEIYGVNGKITFSFFDNSPIVVETANGSDSYAFPLLPHVQEPMIWEVVQYFLGRRDNPCDVRVGQLGIQIMDSFTIETD